MVFILAADTGVTKSDLAIWREHLITEDDDTDSRLVVLNKIDTMWDALSTPAQVQAQIDRQRATSAEILGLPLDQVIPVSAQKGLVAKVNNDAALLQASRLPVLEQALGEGVMGQRQKILRSAVAAGIAELRAEAGARHQHPPARPGRADDGAARACAARTPRSSSTCARASSRSRASSTPAAPRSRRCARCT